MSFYEDQELHQKLIVEICDGIKTLLLQKNRNYGSSFATQSSALSSASAEQKLFIRIEDKLKRIKTLSTRKDANASDESIMDTICDAAGYFILLLVLKRLDELELNRARAHP